MSRSRTRERREERQRQQRQQRQAVLVGGMVALVVLAVFVIILSNQPAEAIIPEGSVERYSGIPQSVTDEGYPILGNPDAPVQLVEYSSFDCPHCQEFHETVTVNLIDRVRAGEISFTYVPIYATSDIPNGQGAARAAICAAEQDAFWTYHDALFTWQAVYGNQAFSQNRLLSGIENLGIDRAAWDECMRSGLPDRIMISGEEARTNIPGYTGTPMVEINGVAAPLDLEGINSVIDQALASSLTVPEIAPIAEPETTEQPTDGATTETTEEP